MVDFGSECVKIAFKETGLEMWPDSPGPGQGPLLCSSEHGNGLLGSIKHGKFLTSCQTLSFWRRNWHHEVSVCFMFLPPLHKQLTL
jgi:hypothetical protein